MAYRTAQESAGLPRTALLLARPELYPSTRGPIGFSAGYAPVAVIGVCLLLWLLVSGSFWAGRRVERASQLGQVLALQQMERETWAAVRALDSISMRYQITMLRTARLSH